MQKLWHGISITTKELGGNLPTTRQRQYPFGLQKGLLKIKKQGIGRVTIVGDSYCMWVYLGFNDEFLVIYPTLHQTQGFCLFFKNSLQHWKLYHTPFKHLGYCLFVPLAATSPWYICSPLLFPFFSQPHTRLGGLSLGFHSSPLVSLKFCPSLDNMCLHSLGKIVLKALLIDSRTLIFQRCLGIFNISRDYN